MGEMKKFAILLALSLVLPQLAWASGLRDDLLLVKDELSNGSLHLRSASTELIELNRMEKTYEELTFEEARLNSVMMGLSSDVNKTRQAMLERKDHAEYLKKTLSVISPLDENRTLRYSIGGWLGFVVGLWISILIFSIIWR